MAFSFEERTVPQRFQGFQPQSGLPMPFLEAQRMVQTWVNQLEEPESDCSVSDSLSQSCHSYSNDSSLSPAYQSHGHTSGEDIMGQEYRRKISVESSQSSQSYRMTQKERLEHRRRAFQKRDSSCSNFTSSSIDAILEERKADPEEVLLNLGFGPNVASISDRLPLRFLAGPSLASGISVEDFVHGNSLLKSKVEDNQEVLNKIYSQLPAKYYRRRPSDACSDLHHHFSVADEPEVRRSSFTSGITPKGNHFYSILHPDNSSALRNQGFYDKDESILKKDTQNGPIHSELRRGSAGTIDLRRKSMPLERRRATETELLPRTRRKSADEKQTRMQLVRTDSREKSAGVLSTNSDNVFLVRSSSDNNNNTNGGSSSLDRSPEVVVRNRVNSSGAKFVKNDSKGEIMDILVRDSEGDIGSTFHSADPSDTTFSQVPRQDSSSSSEGGNMREPITVQIWTCEDEDGQDNGNRRLLVSPTGGGGSRLPRIRQDNSGDQPSGTSLLLPILESFESCESDSRTVVNEDGDEDGAVSPNPTTILRQQDVDDDNDGDDDNVESENKREVRDGTSGVHRTVEREESWELSSVERSDQSSSDHTSSCDPAVSPGECSVAFSDSSSGFADTEDNVSRSQSTQRLFNRRLQQNRRRSQTVDVLLRASTFCLDSPTSPEINFLDKAGTDGSRFPTLQKSPPHWEQRNSKLEKSYSLDEYTKVFGINEGESRKSQAEAADRESSDSGRLTIDCATDLPSKPMSSTFSSSPGSVKLVRGLSTGIPAKENIHRPLSQKKSAPAACGSDNEEIHRCCSSAFDEDGGCSACERREKRRTNGTSKRILKKGDFGGRPNSLLPPAAGSIERPLPISQASFDERLDDMPPLPGPRRHGSRVSVEGSGFRESSRMSRSDSQTTKSSVGASSLSDWASPFPPLEVRGRVQPRARSPFSRTVTAPNFDTYTAPSTSEPDSDSCPIGIDFRSGKSTPSGSIDTTSESGRPLMDAIQRLVPGDGLNNDNFRNRSSSFTDAATTSAALRWRKRTASPYLGCEQEDDAGIYGVMPTIPDPLATVPRLYPSDSLSESISSSSLSALSRGNDKVGVRQISDYVSSMTSSSKVKDYVCAHFGICDGANAGNCGKMEPGMYEHVQAEVPGRYIEAGKSVQGMVIPGTPPLLDTPARSSPTRNSPLRQFSSGLVDANAVTRVLKRAPTIGRERSISESRTLESLTNTDSHNTAGAHRPLCRLKDSRPDLPPLHMEEEQAVANGDTDGMAAVSADSGRSSSGPSPETACKCGGAGKDTADNDGKMDSSDRKWLNLLCSLVTTEQTSLGESEEFSQKVMNQYGTVLGEAFGSSEKALSVVASAGSLGTNGSDLRKRLNEVLLFQKAISVQLLGIGKALMVTGSEADITELEAPKKTDNPNGPDLEKDQKIGNDEKGMINVPSGDGVNSPPGDGTNSASVNDVISPPEDNVAQDRPEGASCSGSMPTEWEDSAVLCHTHLVQVQESLRSMEVEHKRQQQEVKREMSIMEEQLSKKEDEITSLTAQLKALQATAAPIKS